MGVLLDLMPLPGGVGEAAAAASILKWSVIVIVLLLFSYITIVWVHDGIGNGRRMRYAYCWEAPMVFDLFCKLRWFRDTCARLNGQQALRNGTRSLGFYKKRHLSYITRSGQRKTNNLRSTQDQASMHS